MFRRMQVCPFNVMKSKFGFEHRKFLRLNINIESTVEVTTEIKPTRGKNRPLAIQRAVGIVCRRSRGNAIALYQASVNRNPVSHGWNFTLQYSCSTCYVHVEIFPCEKTF